MSTVHVAVQVADRMGHRCMRPRRVINDRREQSDSTRCAVLHCTVNEAWRFINGQRNTCAAAGDSVPNGTARSSHMCARRGEAARQSLTHFSRVPDGRRATNSHLYLQCDTCLLSDSRRLI